MKRILAVMLALCLFLSCPAFAENNNPALMLAMEGYDLSKTGYSFVRIFGLLDYGVDLPANQISQKTLEDGWVEYVFQPYGPYELNGQIYKTGTEEEPLISVSSSGSHLHLKPLPDGTYLTVDEAEKALYKDGVLPETLTAETITLNGIKARCIHPKTEGMAREMMFLVCRLLILPENSATHDFCILDIKISGKPTLQTLAVCNHIANSLRPFSDSADVPR